MALAPQVVIAARQQMSRKIRSPSHPFYVKAPPFCLCPFFIAPVLPGETMKNLMLQARIVTQPIKSPLIGWWCEFYFFYVKLRDLADRDEYTKMLLDPEWDASVTDSPTANNQYYHPAGVGQQNYVQKCLWAVADEYFRDEGKAGSDYLINDGTKNWYSVKVNAQNVLQSVHGAADVATEDVAITVGADDQIRASEIELAMRQWEMLKMANLTTMSYEDFLATYGIRPKPEEVHRPELVRYVREWSYPSNTVDPVTGVPSSAVSWSIAERADKDRFFREPGFLYGLWVTRPKVYLSNVSGTFTSSLNNAFAWLPAAMGGNAEASMKNLPDNVGPLQAATDPAGYWFDVKDLFLYGEQFFNFASADLDSWPRLNKVPLPSADLENREYVVDYAAVQALFKEATKAWVEADGIVSLNIASVLRETTPQGGPATDV